MTVYRGGWPYRHPPNVNFVLNTESPQARGLVGWWPTAQSVGNVLRDQSGLGRHGIVQPGTLFGIDPALGRVYAGDANTSHFIEIADNDDFSALPFLSLSAWVRPTSTTGFACIVGKGRAEAYEYAVVRNAGYYQMFSWILTGANYLYGGSPGGSNVAAIGKLDHIVTTLDTDAPEYKLYVNGVLVATDTVPDDVPYGNGEQEVQIGRSHDSIWPWEGNVGDVRLLSKILSASEILHLYQNPWELYRPIIPHVLGKSPVISGEVTWGHDQGVIEANIRDFAVNWTGTGAISGGGDAETLDLETTEYMISEVVDTGTDTVTLLQNNYDPSGDDVDMDYRHGNTQAACEAAGWNNYTVPFESLGYVQIRMTSTL